MEFLRKHWEIIFTLLYIAVILLTLIAGILLLTTPLYMIGVLIIIIILGITLCEITG